MSRSYKKFPGWTDYHSSYTKWAKRQASKSVRSFDDYLPDGKSYRKLYNPYNIRDYKCVWYSKKECEEFYNDNYTEIEKTIRIKRSYSK